MASNHRLCRTCATLFDNPHTDDFQYQGTHHANYNELERSADRGCYICIRLRIEVQKTLKSRSAVRPSLKHSKYSVSPTHDLREWKLDIDLGLDHGTVQAHFVVLDHLQYPREDFKCQISPNTLDPKCMSLARAWLRQCREHHQCQTACPSTIKGIYPTRLLHIRRSKNGSTKLRLAYPRALSVEVEYLTLSHMWGDQKFLKLSTQNHDGFLKFIPTGSLSQTFRDAVDVTTELGFQYLWIDSLCILQDDEQDWKNESERMASIYKNAVCNLCASVPASDRDGLLSETRAINPLPPLVHFDGDTCHRTKMLSEDRPWNRLRDSPLYRRAWVLQEQILAARAIHFGSDQIHWECAETYANEVWPIGWPVAALQGDVGPARNPFFRRFLDTQREKVAWHITVDQSHQDMLFSRDPYYVWRRIIEDYSSREITYPSDRLPALAGLIAQYRQLGKGEMCAAGIWKSDAYNQLLWEQVSPTATRSATSSQNPDWSLAPSWSWASVNAAVRWGEHVDDVQNSLCSIAIKQHSKEQYPSLQIRGYLLQLPLQECQSVPDRKSSVPLSTELYYQPFRLRCKYMLDYWFLQKLPVSTSYDPEALVNNTMILPMQWHRFTFHSLKCLLLWKDPSLEEGCYRRVGYVMMVEDTIGDLKNLYPRKEFIQDLYDHSVNMLGDKSTDCIEGYDDGSCLIEIR